MLFLHLITFEKEKSITDTQGFSGHTRKPSGVNTRQISIKTGSHPYFVYMHYSASPLSSSENPLS